MRKAERRPAQGPYIVLVATLLLTIAAAAFVGLVGGARDQARFEGTARVMADRIRSRIDTYVALLQAGRGLFAAMDGRGVEPDAAMWHQWVTQLDIPERYPGIQGIGYSARFLADARDSLVRAVRAHGDHDFHLWPDSPRAEYDAILFLEPLDRRNQAALGYNMATEPRRRAAMERARDTGLPSASAMLTLVQEIDQAKQAGFLIYLPVYRGGVVPPTVAERRQALQGFVYSPFRADDLFAGIFETGANSALAFRVFDGAEPDPARLLHVSEGFGQATVIPLAAAAHVEIAGRPWTIEFRSLPGFEPVSGGVLATGVALLGSAFALSLFFIMRSEVRARAAAERSEDERSRFFAAMSHELRTPLNAIVGYNALLLDGIYGSLTPQQTRGLERSRKAADQLVDLVNDVLDLSKIEARKVDLELGPVEVGGLVEDIFVTIRPMAEARGCALALDVDGRRTIRSDPRRVRQILLNLLSNAVKFGAGCPICVRCFPADGGVAIEVEDHGPGIAAEDQQRIFDEFVQLGPNDGSGTGLGLTISRRLAELLGGYLVVQSEPGTGSTFRLVLPRELS